MRYSKDEDMATFIAENPSPFPPVSSQPVAVDVAEGGGDHMAVYQNFHKAISQGTQVRADGKQGRMSLELANAMIYSSHTGQEVKLPLDRAAYGELLKKLQRG